jgi:hypothetical protein
LRYTSGTEVHDLTLGIGDGEAVTVPGEGGQPDGFSSPSAA